VLQYFENARSAPVRLYPKSASICCAKEQQRFQIKCLNTSKAQLFGYKKYANFSVSGVEEFFGTNVVDPELLYVFIPDTDRYFESFGFRSGANFISVSARIFQTYF
jgi:hypothetical protein